MSEERLIQLVNFNSSMKRLEKANIERERTRSIKVSKANNQVDRLYMAIFFLVITIYLLTMILVKVAIRWKILGKKKALQRQLQDFLKIDIFKFSAI